MFALLGELLRMTQNSNFVYIIRMNKPFFVQIDVITSLLSGRLVREQISPAMLSAVQSQMGAAEPEITLHDIFNVDAAAKGLARNVVERIPKMIITDNNNADAFGEKVSCSVCLQVPIFVKLN
ncbi:hypothetical protein GQ457_04G035750 [Hibiscus cannabinus]